MAWAWCSGNLVCGGLGFGWWLFFGWVVIAGCVVIDVRDLCEVWWVLSFEGY